MPHEIDHLSAEKTIVFELSGIKILGFFLNERMWMISNIYSWNCYHSIMYARK